MQHLILLRNCYAISNGRFHASLLHIFCACVCLLLVLNSNWTLNMALIWNTKNGLNAWIYHICMANNNVRNKLWIILHLSMRAFKALRSSVCNNTFWIIEYHAWTNAHAIYECCEINGHCSGIRSLSQSRYTQQNNCSISRHW